MTTHMTGTHERVARRASLKRNSRSAVTRWRGYEYEPRLPARRTVEGGSAPHGVLKPYGATALSLTRG